MAQPCLPRVHPSLDSLSRSCATSKEGMSARRGSCGPHAHHSLHLIRITREASRGPSPVDATPCLGGCPTRQKRARRHARPAHTFNAPPGYPGGRRYRGQSLPSTLCAAIVRRANLPDHLGFRRTMITESPRRNILEMNRSLFTGLLPAAPLPFFGIWQGMTSAAAECIACSMLSESMSTHHVCVLVTEPPWKEEKPSHPSLRHAHLCPKLLDVFENHVAVPVKGLDAAQQLPVVATVDEHLRGEAMCRCLSLGNKRLPCQLGHPRRPPTPTCELVFTLVVSTERGPVRNNSSSRCSSSSTEGFIVRAGA